MDETLREAYEAETHVAYTNWRHESRLAAWFHGTRSNNAVLLFVVFFTIVLAAIGVEAGVR